MKSFPVLLLALVFSGNAFAKSEGISPVPQAHPQQSAVFGIKTVTPQNGGPKPSNQSNTGVVDQLEKQDKCDQLPVDIQEGQDSLNVGQLAVTGKSFDYVCNRTNQDIKTYNQLNCVTSKLSSVDCDQKKKEMTCAYYTATLEAIKSGPLPDDSPLLYTIASTFMSPGCGFEKYLHSCLAYGKISLVAIQAGCSDVSFNGYECNQTTYNEKVQATHGSLHSCANNP